jgi:hypothetical protein
MMAPSHSHTYVSQTISFYYMEDNAKSTRLKSSLAKDCAAICAFVSCEAPPPPSSCSLFSKVELCPVPSSSVDSVSESSHTQSLIVLTVIHVLKMHYHIQPHPPLDPHYVWCLNVYNFWNRVLCIMMQLSLADII